MHGAYYAPSAVQLKQDKKAVATALRSSVLQFRAFKRPPSDGSSWRQLYFPQLSFDPTHIGRHVVINSGNSRLHGTIVLRSHALSIRSYDRLWRPTTASLCIS